MYVKNPIPCVGISFGVDRIHTILEAQRGKVLPLLKREVNVYIASTGSKDSDGLLLERMKIAGQLWNAGIRAEYAAKVKPKLPQQFKAAKDVPLAILLGQGELAAGQVRLKMHKAGGDETNDKDRGQLVSIENLVEEVKKLL